MNIIFDNASTLSGGVIFSSHQGATVPEEPGQNGWIFGKRIKPKAPQNWTWGARHPKTGMRVRIYK